MILAGAKKISCCGGGATATTSTRMTLIPHLHDMILAAAGAAKNVGCSCGGGATATTTSTRMTSRIGFTCSNTTKTKKSEIKYQGGQILL